MGFLFQVTCVALLIVAVATGAPQDLETPAEKPHYELDDAPALFAKYIKDYDKTYKDDADKQIHYEAFLETLKRINELNSDPKQGSAWFDINQFADYTEEQSKSMRGLLVPESE